MAQGYAFRVPLLEAARPPVPARNRGAVSTRACSGSRRTARRGLTPWCSGVFAFLAHESLAINLFRRELVVRATAEAEVRHRALATTSHGKHVIELEQRP